MPRRSLSRSHTTQSAAGAAAVAAADAYAAAPVGTPVTIPANVPAERVAIISGAASPPPPPQGTTVIKPAPGQTAQPPQPAPVFDDADDGADDAEGNPYLSLIGDGGGPATLTDKTTSTTARNDDDGRWMDSVVELFLGSGNLSKAIGVAAVGLVLWFLWRRRS